MGESEGQRCCLQLGEALVEAGAILEEEGRGLRALVVEMRGAGIGAAICNSGAL